MHRRQALAAGTAIAFGGIAGCFSEDASGGNTDGYGPEFEDPPEDRSIGTESYERYPVEGIDVPLAPVEDVYYWYQRQEARMADARGSDQYESRRITGAVLSPADPRVRSDDDPVEDWSKDERIVTYCGCPHTLAGARAAQLIDEGYEEVYAIEEGLGGWIDNGYPLEGSNVDAARVSYDISGRSTPANAGELVMLEQLDAERYEAAPIGDDGSYSMTLHYSGSSDTRFRLDAPDYTLEATLEELTSTQVTPDMAV